MSDETETATAPESRRATKKLPSTRLGFSKQLDILRAFAHLSSGNQPVHYTKVAEAVQAHESNVSTMNPFFVENGFLIKSGNGQLPSAAVQEFGRKYSWNKDTAAHALAPVVSATWFAEALLNRLHFNPLTTDQGIEILAAACSAEPDAKPQLRMLIDYLDASGLLRRENGQLIAIRREQPQPPTPEPAVELKASPVTPGAPVIGTPAASPGNISFQVSVDVNMADLAGWPADRITAFFTGVAAVIAAQNASKVSGPTG